MNLKELKRTYATSTNRSRISNYDRSKLTMQTDASKVTGEMQMNRPQFMMSKGFLTNEELKMGDP